VNSNIAEKRKTRTGNFKDYLERKQIRDPNHGWAGGAFHRAASSSTNCWSIPTWDTAGLNVRSIFPPEKWARDPRRTRNEVVTRHSRQGHDFNIPWDFKLGQEGPRGAEAAVPCPFPIPFIYGGLNWCTNAIRMLGAIWISTPPCTSYG